MMYKLLYITVFFLFSPSLVAGYNKVEFRFGNRYFEHGQLRIVTPVIKNGKIALWWKAPSGKQVFLSLHETHKGWKVRLRQAIRDKIKYIAVGGRFFFTSPSKGRVYISLVKRVRHIYRGVRPVKLDGRMPIYMATILPRHSQDRVFVYKLWGRVQLYREKQNNKIICLYGEWIDFKGRSLGVINQVRGVKGEAIFSFAPRFRFPKGWPSIWLRRKKILLYQQSWLNQHPIKLPSHIIPIVKIRKYQEYLNICQTRLSELERRTSSLRDHLFLSPPALFSFFSWSFFESLILFP